MDHDGNQNKINMNSIYFIQVLNTYMGKTTPTNINDNDIFREVQEITDNHRMSIEVQFHLYSTYKFSPPLLSEYSCAVSTTCKTTELSPQLSIEAI